MPVTLQNVIDRTRSNLDEASAIFWSNVDLVNWVNDGCRDLARRAEDLLSFNTSLSITAGTYLYALPTDVIRVHRAEFVPTGSSFVYPLQASTYQEMDQYWGLNQAVQGSYPSFFVIRGFPGGTQSGSVDGRLMMQLYPVPAQGGLLNLFYYRLPYRFADASAPELAKNVELPEGWDDLIVLYAEWNALRKTRDARWQEAKAIYEEKVEYLLNVSRQWHDQAQSFIMAGGRGGPGYFGDEGWWW